MNDNSVEGQRAHIRTLAELSQRYDEVDYPHESIGPESGQSFLDYGPPVVLTDSRAPVSSPHSHTRPEDSPAEVKNIFAAAPDRSLFRRMIDRVSDSFTGTPWI
jgi:hypothetical protein